jgi:hypothetical protein
MQPSFPLLLQNGMVPGVLLKISSSCLFTPSYPSRMVGSIAGFGFYRQPPTTAPRSGQGKAVVMAEKYLSCYGKHRFQKKKKTCPS